MSERVDVCAQLRIRASVINCYKTRTYTSKLKNQVVHTLNRSVKMSNYLPLFSSNSQARIAIKFNRNNKNSTGLLLDNGHNRARTIKQSISAALSPFDYWLNRDLKILLSKNSLFLGETIILSIYIFCRIISSILLSKYKRVLWALSSDLINY